MALLGKGEIEVDFVQGATSLTDLVQGALDGASAEVQEFAADATLRYEEVTQTYLQGIEEIKAAQRDLRSSVTIDSDPEFRESIEQNIDLLDQQKRALEQDYLTGIGEVAPDLKAVGEEIQGVGEASIRTGLSADRLSSGLFSIANAAASGRGDIAAFSFVTQELAEIAFRAGPAFSEAGGGLKGLTAVAKGLGTSIKTSLGPLIAVVAIIGLATAGFLRWKRAQEEARREQEQWTKAVIEGEDAARRQAEAVVQNAVVQDGLADSLLRVGLDAGQAVDAIEGEQEQLQGLRDRYSELNDELGRFSDTFAFTSRSRDENTQALKEEREALAEVIVFLDDEIEKRERAIAIAEVYARIQERLAREAAGTVSIIDDLATGLITQATAFDILSAAGTNIPRIIELIATSSDDLNDIVRELGGEFPSTIEGLEGFIAQLERSPEFVAENAVALELLKRLLADLKGERDAEADAADQAEKDKQAALEETTRKEREQLEVIEERIEARLREGSQGLQLLDAIDRVREAEEKLAKARKPEDRAQAEQDLVSALIDVVAISENAGENIDRLTQRVDEFVEQGLLAPEVGEAFKETIATYGEEIDAVEQANAEVIDSITTKAQEALRSLDSGRGTLQDVVDLITEVDRSTISVDIEANIAQLTGVGVLLQTIQRLIAQGLAGAGQGIRVVGNNIALASGGFIRAGDVALVGEQGPELAIGRPGGAQVLPFDPNAFGAQSPNPQTRLPDDERNPTNIEVNINNPKTNDINQDSQRAGLIIGATVGG